MSAREFVFRSKIARRMPDPVFDGCSRVTCMVRAKDVPQGLPLDPNPRAQNINRSVYKDVLASLLNEDCEPNTFHLKNKGITALARSVTKEAETDDVYVVRFDSGQGIVDGGHTYRVVLEGQKETELSDQQFVRFDFLLGVPEGLPTEIAGGLNTAVQVQEMSLANLEGDFKWIRDAMQGHQGADLIAYRENESDKALDVRTVVAFLTLFNIDLYPNDSTEYPIIAYSSKAAALSQFLSEKGKESFPKLARLLPEILILADVISSGARDKHNLAGGKGGKLAFMDGRTSGDYLFPFAGTSSKYRLMTGALFPMLGAFRWFVETGPDGKFRWKGSFEDVKRMWTSSAAELMRATQSTSDELGRNPNAIGKSRNHWSTLHSLIVKRDLMNQV